MKNYLNIIKKSSLFYGIREEEIESLLKCLSATTKKYTKNQFVFSLGENIDSVGIVLSGSVHIVKEDFWGNSSILSKVVPGQVFGETFASMQTKELGVNVVAQEETEVLLLNVRGIITICSANCEFHTRLVRNMLFVLAEKNYLLTRKMEHMTQRTTREKLLSYLSDESQKNVSSVFEIPFNRQQLADYLSVERSAMSNELSKLRDEGILEFNKNHFELLIS